MTRRISLPPLVGLGLTALESEIYAYLVQNSPATGYRVARAIGKPAANTYSALETLQGKGAVIVEDSENRLCRAVPLGEFLGGLEKQFFRLKEEALEQLARLRPAPDDARVYHLGTPEQVFQRFRGMLGKCEAIAALDLFPSAVGRLRADIAAATERGIRVAVKAYEPAEIDGAIVVVDPAGAAAIKRWPGQWANGVIDGREHLMALLSKDGTRVNQAVWSANGYTSWVYHSALMHELLHGALASGLRVKDGRVVFPKLYRELRSLKGEEAPGYVDLLDRLNSGG